MKVCCCSLAGTPACLSCQAEQPTNYATYWSSAPCPPTLHQTEDSLQKELERIEGILNKLKEGNVK